MHRLIVSLSVLAFSALGVTAPAGSVAHAPARAQRVIVPKSKMSYLPPRPTTPPYDHIADLKGRYVVVDISDFQLYEMQDGLIVGTLPVSSGKGGHYDEFYKGHENSGDANTPTGVFTAHRQDISDYNGGVDNMGPDGWYDSTIGLMKWPVWFKGNLDAIHGENVPYRTNASHGCVRIPWSDAYAFYHWIPEKATVIVQQ